MRDSEICSGIGVPIWISWMFKTRCNWRLFVLRKRGAYSNFLESLPVIMASVHKMRFYEIFTMSFAGFSIDVNHSGITWNSNKACWYSSLNVYACSQLVGKSDWNSYRETHWTAYLAYFTAVLKCVLIVEKFIDMGIKTNMMHEVQNM